MTERMRTLLLLAVCVGFAAYNGWRGFDREITNDEVGWIQPESIADIYWDAESSINPPLLRILLNAPFSSEVTPHAGRILSFVCFLGAVALLFGVARYVGGSDVCGVLAGVLLASNELSLDQAVMFRSYAPWLAVCAWHLWALARLLREGARCSSSVRAQVAASAVLLPWIHYTSVLFLLCEGVAILVVDRRRWRDLTLFVPAAVAFTPALWMILSPVAKAWIPPSRTPMRDLELFATAGVCMHLAIVAPLPLVCALLWRRCSVTQRVLMVAWCAFLAALMVAATRHSVRAVGAIWFAPGLFVVLATLFRLGRKPVTRALLMLLPAIYLMAAVSRPPIVPWRETNMTVALAGWERWERAAEGRPIYARPDSAVLMLHYAIYRQLFRERPKPFQCADYHWCLVHDGVVVIGKQSDGPVDGLLFDFHCYDAPPLPVGCTALEQADCLRVSNCRLPK